MLTVTQFKLWIKLLRSGKYKKTRGQLSSHHGTYCPLGLLAVEVLNLHLNHDCTVATKKKGDSWEDQFSPIPITFIKADKQEVINNWNDDEENTNQRV